MLSGCFSYVTYVQWISQKVLLSNVSAGYVYDDFNITELSHVTMKYDGIVKLVVA